MSTLQLVHLACAASYVGIGGYVVWRAPRLQRSAGVAGITACFMWWSSCLVVAHDPDASRHQAILAYNIGAFAWASFGSLALVFAFAFTGAGERLSRLPARLALIVPPLVFIVAQWNGWLAADYVRYPWGWAFVWSSSPLTWLFYVYYGAYVTYAMALVFQAGRRSPDRLVRRQASIIIYTGMVPFTCATTTDVILPWLGYHQIPNLAPAFLLAWTIGIGIAIVRYRLLELTPETAAAEILAAMRDGMLLIGRDDRVISYNRAAATLLDRGPDLLRAELHEIVRRHPPLGPRESFELRTDDRSLAVSLTSVTDAHGTQIGSICLLRDVTDQKRAEQALNEATAMLEARVIERTRELDATNRELGRALRILGALHSTIDAIHKADSVQQICTNVAEQLMTAFEIPGGCRIVFDGEPFVSKAFVEITSPARFAIVAGTTAHGELELHVQGPDLVPAEREVIERVASEIGQSVEGLRLRTAIAQTDRLASVGVLAAGVAHEINNPLTYLTLGLYDVQEMVADGAPRDVPALRERVEEAVNASNRIAKIVRELGSFVRDADDVRAVPVASAIASAIAMATHQIKHRARLVTKLAAVGVVSADQGRLTQVFLNLLVNAAHAIPDGNVDAHEIEITSRDEANEVIVTVRDTGQGIPERDLVHIFEPFYSTKNVEEGSGLGLSISHKIVQSLGGRISATSVVGRGSTFEVRLPHTTATQAPPLAKRTDAPDLAGPRRRVLIVDDDQLVARALGRILKAHDVELATSGQEARRLLDGGRSYDVVMCDLMMPEVSGPELHTWVVAHRPEIAARMVFMTGGALTVETAAFCERHRANLIAKPFVPESILAVVARVTQPG